MIQSGSGGLVSRLNHAVESQWFDRLITIVIFLNAITLGLETIPNLEPQNLSVLIALDRIFLVVFCVEIGARMIVHQRRFFHDSWRIFDFIVVSIALLPTSGAFAVLRAFRVLRVLRLISAVPALRRVVTGLLKALPGLGAVVAIMLLIFYVGSVMATKLFGNEFQEWFGSIPASAYSLFQIMTLESWSMGIVRPVMERFPYAWMFFLPFILIATFTMLNLFIAVIVNAMHAETNQTAEERAELGHEERQQLLQEIMAMRNELKSLLAINPMKHGDRQNFNNPLARN